MAYGNIYYAGWSSPSKQGYLYIDKLDYVGGTTQLILKRDGFAISTNWQFPLLGMTAEFEIMNLKIDFFALLPLLTGKEAEYRVRIETISPSNISLFEGFLNCETITEKYLHRQSIKFVASSYLAKLETVHPISVDTLQNITFIKLIDEILRSTSSDFPIRVNTKLCAEGDILTEGHTLFDKNGFFTELFWEDNVERTTSLDVLQSILTSFNCYLYWYDRKWYIERYEEIWATTIGYVEYSNAQAIAGEGTVVSITNTVKQVHDLVFIDQSQTLAVNPGLKTIKITLDDQRFTNLVPNDFSNITQVTDKSVTPSLRTWDCSSLEVIDLTGMGLGNSGIFSKPGKPFSIFSNSIMKNGTPTDYSDGLRTSFRVSVISETDCIEIKFGYNLQYSFYKASDWELSDYLFRFYYYLRISPEMEYIVANNSDEDTKTYHTEYSTDPLSLIQYVEVPGSSFDVNTECCEVSINIPIGLVDRYDIINPEIFLGKVTGDKLFTLCLGAITMVLSGSTDEQIQWAKDNDHYNYTDEKIMEVQVKWGYVGDVSITETGDIQENVIEGDYEPNFLNKEEITLDLYDAESYSYKNAILRGTDLYTRTERWGISDAEVLVIVQRGVCYSSVNNPPTIADEYTINRTGLGEFTSKLFGLASNTLYRVRAYAIDNNGTVYYADAPAGGTLPFTTLGLSVGDKYGGGTIGYIFKPGDVGYVSGQVHGLIVSDYQYKDKIGVISGGGPYTSDANRIDIGGGFANTEGILANVRQKQQGLSKLITYRINNYYDDWYLPDYNELKAIWANRVAIGGFTNWYYWTSTEPYNFSSAYKYAYAIYFGNNNPPIAIYKGYNNGCSTYWKKTHIFYFRFVRNF